jgi:localization factor PodJL
MIKEAMPRQAVEALEKEVRALSERIQNERQAGADAGILSGVERGLTEVRDALRALTPAENLRGFDEAVQSLSQKIDRIAISSHDPAAIGQLESAMVGLRSIVAHVASNDALAKLSEDVRKLSVKVEEAATPPGFFINLERRLATIADALEGRHQDDTVAMALRSGDPSGGDRAPAYADSAATQQLEMRITQLVEKLDAADTRLNHLETIERGVSELLTRFDQQRTPSRPEGEAPEVLLLKRDVRRTQDSLEAVHGTLGHVVDRLAVIETGIRGGGPGGQNPSGGPDTDPSAPSGKSSTGPAGPESLLSSASLVLQTAPSASASERTALARQAFAIGGSFDAPSPAHGKPQTGPQQRDTSGLAPTTGTERRAIDTSLPPDHPLEPGLGALRGVSPADRIAASEAALGSVKPAADAEPSGRADFIAAARRAAQAAGGGETSQRASDRRTAAADAKSIRSGGRETTSWFSRHVRSLLAGASAILLVAGGAYLATVPFGANGDGAEATAVDGNTEPVLASAASVPAFESSKGSSFSDRSGTGFGAPASGMVLPFDPNHSASSFASAEAEPRSTGSIRAPASSLASRPADPASMPDAVANQRSLIERLPVGIGGNLRAAAIKGDPAAQYEVALRLADGRGVPQDLPSAVAWFTRAAEQGLAPAQFRLGGLYEKGSGVKKDLESARRLYTAAGQAGNAKAMHNMAVLYAEGVDGKSDYQSAAKWFRKAADYGVQDSQYNLGILYARGIGVEVNLTEAYKWFTLAARDGDKDSVKKRDDIGARLDQASLTAARNAARIWVAEQQPEAAILVKGPAGGWDKAGVANAKRQGSKS